MVGFTGSPGESNVVQYGTLQTCPRVSSLKQRSLDSLQGASAVYSTCARDGDCSTLQFCGKECFTGGCRGINGASVCQPCAECHFDFDAVAGNCSRCSSVTKGTIIGASSLKIAGSTAGYEFTANTSQTRAVIRRRFAVDLSCGTPPFAPLHSTFLPTFV